MTATLIVGPVEHDRLKAFASVASSDIDSLGLVWFEVAAAGIPMRVAATDGFIYARSELPTGHEGEVGFYGHDGPGTWAVNASDLAKALGSRPPKTKGWTVIEFRDTGGGWSNEVTVTTRKGGTMLDNHPRPAPTLAYPDVDHDHGVMAAAIDWRLLDRLMATAPDPEAGVRLVQPWEWVDGGFGAKTPDATAPAVAIDTHGNEFGLIAIKHNPPVEVEDNLSVVEVEGSDKASVVECRPCGVAALFGSTCRDHA